MWTAVAPFDLESPAPSARSKHSATLIGDHLYLLGGRNGNLPLKDFWQYNIVTGKWQQLKPSGDRLPCLQEHSTVAYKDNIYVFGGEVSFSAGTETPLWIYDIKHNTWKKIKSKKGVSTPKGRRGHTALVHRGHMLIYGGYQDLRGSCSELWAFHFETESWHLVSSIPPGRSNNADYYPAARHKHSAVIHDDSMWIYGGMTDLQARCDLWRWDITSSTWTCVKQAKINPGPLHSHSACRLPSGMLVFGGETNGQMLNDLWKFNFSTEIWEKVIIPGTKPQPRAESIAFAVSELALNGPHTTPNSLETKANRTRLRTCNSADRGGSRHSSYFPNNRIKPYEQTFVFKPDSTNYNDATSDVDTKNMVNKTGFLQEISKLSISRLNKNCSYSVLTGCPTESTESLLKPPHHCSPPPPTPATTIKDIEETELSTPTRGTMVKSKSAYAIKKKYPSDETNATNPPRRRVEFDISHSKPSLPREPISVPNFSLLTLPTPVLTPVEATRLVFLDTEEDNYHYDNEFVTTNYEIETMRHMEPEDESPVKETGGILEEMSCIKRNDSYSSHLAYADNPLYQHMINSNSKYSGIKDTTYDENCISSTSDYCSIETVNRLSSASNYSVKTNTPQEERNNRGNKENTFGFSNPNYIGPELKNNKQSNMKHCKNGHDEEEVELQTLNGTITKNTKVFFRNSIRSSNRPPKSLDLEDRVKVKDGFKQSRALSASRAERNSTKNRKVESESCPSSLEPFVPLYVFIVGGKEQGQVTVFQRPLSIWKLKLF